MNFFQILKKTKPTGVIDDSQTIVFDFTLRAPYWSYRPVEYREYQPFVSLRPVLDEHLGKLLPGDIDAGNGDVLDNCIFNMARQAGEDLERQRIDHRDTITRLCHRNKGDRKAFGHELELLQKELADNAAKQSEIKARLEKTKFMGGKENA